jgi:hypothetical protein
MVARLHVTNGDPFRSVQKGVRGDPVVAKGLPKKQSP